MIIDLYVRLSIYDDLKDGLERQEADLKKWAKTNKHTVRKVWRDKGVSAYKTGIDRAAFESATKAVLDGTVEGLAVWRIDRLSRKGAGQVGLLMDDLAKAKGTIWFVSNGLNTADENHRLPVILMSEQARAESANTGKRIADKNRALIDAGLPILGKRRFGYLPADQKAKRVVNTVMHPEEGPQVQALFAEYLAGASVNTLAKKMGWRNFRVRETLKSKAYIGILEVKGVEYEAHELVERLIDLDTFNDVQARLAVQAEKHGPTNPGDRVKHPLTGIAVCGVCGGTLSYRNNYLCLADLSHPTIKDEILEYAVEAALMDLLMDPAREITDPAALSLKNVNAEIDELEAQKADILTGLSHGLKMADLTPHLSPVLIALEEAAQRREALLNASVQARITRDIAAEITGASLADKLRAYKAVHTLHIDDFRTLVSTMLHVVVHPGRGAERVAITPRVID